ncbi:MAG: tRNA epoxyqueuosine(34) reductase QueG [Chloroflexi bacterium]|nr:MAG: tRNA epoxyqueuosine(34) reductase QueG [Chloroflexota bacterium]MBL1194522.1 tRNA epoxyqueuosine(34) reductase QueG [Chloroflexota bacterium]NOH11810.1 tRNA epoxyqueuosine(34) reductase QueG [Chloroflexota bacterium]
MSPLPLSSAPIALKLTNKIKQEARRLGFDFVGVTKPDLPPGYPVYEGWLKAGHHGEMNYLATDRARQRRADLHQVLLEVESILVLGIHHDNPQQAQPPDDGKAYGRMAAYAWGDDYHDVLPERLKALVAFIETEVGHAVPNRWYTDTGPILERDLASMAGIGWIGKNSMLINPQAGSYFMLAEIFLGIQLEIDTPFESDHCGSCTRCIDACPTDCILPNRTLDARRCISYLTIELKGTIPIELRSQMGDWVFGCDICQEVCPWNLRFAPATGDEHFTPRSGLPVIDLQSELQLTPQEFNRKFKGSPVKRTKRRGYLRNVTVALGNSSDPSVIPPLTEALENDPEPLVRGNAAWALGQFDDPSAQQSLTSALKTEQDPSVQEEIRAVLNR